MRRLPQLQSRRHRPSPGLGTGQVPARPRRRRPFAKFLGRAGRSGAALRLDAGVAELFADGDQFRHHGAQPLAFGELGAGGGQGLGRDGARTGLALDLRGQDPLGPWPRMPGCARQQLVRPQTL